MEDNGFCPGSQCQQNHPLIMINIKKKYFCKIYICQFLLRSYRNENNNYLEKR